MDALTSNAAAVNVQPAAAEPGHGVVPMRVWFTVGAIAALLMALGWASDCITLQGERTVFTAECRDGVWQGRHCHGDLVAGERLRYRALKSHHEVVFWRVGSAEPSAKFDDCSIRDGRNWTCQPSADSAKSLTQEMRRGVPAASDAGAHNLAGHVISKWRWWLLHLGLPAGSDASS